MFDKVSKVLKFSVISELEDCDYIHIVRLIEHKFCKTDFFILKVKYIDIFFQVLGLFFN